MLGHLIINRKGNLKKKNIMPKNMNKQAKQGYRAYYLKEDQQQLHEDHNHREMREAVV